MNVLVIDCYDSFTYNLCQQIGYLGAKPIVVKNDRRCDLPVASEFDRIVLSPGPGKPEDSGLCLEILETYAKEVPTLGICLGHQAICHFFGGKVIRTGKPVHGMTSEILHDGNGLFTGVENPFRATRYHSLAADESSLPSCLSVSAKSRDDGMIMAVSHKEYPVFGLQFHPESFLTESGDQIMKNFLDMGVVR
ncbi:MAG: aminodeoxychorismate/anthranilate synthase component II [Methanocorpusculum sp.]|nr:aminodeoxychorismate/anthranilate synthase component II [Methanocorpusculum sp.]MDD3046912.1 aminodeoxychorismate/anthranilate synthase component II [Methanocorpusculum sp.]MDD3912167.1 aminodeoxychorismate/anthranilate synthase component II [Methanocorpusculum sp.]